MKPQQQSVKRVTLDSIIGKQSKLKKRIFIVFLLWGTARFTAEFWGTDLVFHYQKTKENQDILRDCKTLNRGKYKPTWWLPFSWMQMIYGAKFDPVPFVPYEREEVISVDNGLVALDWAPVHAAFTNTNQDKMRVLVITHGLTGGSDTNYIRNAVVEAQKHGFRPVVVNNRGLAGSKLRSHKTHDHTRTHDLEAALGFIQKRYPQAPLYGMGISIGANLMLKYAGEKKDQVLLQGIASIANPFDLLLSAQCISHKPFWDYFVVKNLKRNLSQHLEAIAPAAKEFDVELDKALAANKTRDFDEYLTRRIHGYQTVEDMYREVGCKPYLLNVKTPTLMINSLADPISAPAAIPYDEVKLNDKLILVTTQRGGHIDWFTTKKAKRWVYAPALEYLDCIDKRRHANDFEIETADPSLATA